VGGWLGDDDDVRDTYMMMSKNNSKGLVAPRQVTLTAERSILRPERKERSEIKGKKR